MARTIFKEEPKVIDRSKMTQIKPFTVPGEFTVTGAPAVYTTYEEFDFFLRCLNPGRNAAFKEKMKDVIEMSNLGTELVWKFI